MAEFFELNSDTEVKEVWKQERISTNALYVVNGQNYTVTSTSNAKRLRMKIYIDAVSVYNSTTNEENIYKVGQYFECEHLQHIQLLNSFGFHDFYFSCSENDGNGNFQCSINSSSNIIRYYVSSVIFVDSFYNSNFGWYNPNNSNNLIDETETDDTGKWGGFDLTDWTDLIRDTDYIFTGDSTNVEIRGIRARKLLGQVALEIDGSYGTATINNIIPIFDIIVTSGSWFFEHNLVFSSDYEAFYMYPSLYHTSIDRIGNSFSYYRESSSSSARFDGKVVGTITPSNNVY